jgi:hypothetical protein
MPLVVLSAPVVVCKVFHVFCVETAISNYLFLQIMNAGNFGLTMTVKWWCISLCWYCTFWHSKLVNINPFFSAVWSIGHYVSFTDAWHGFASIDCYWTYFLLVQRRHDFGIVRSASMMNVKWPLEYSQCSTDLLKNLKVLSPPMCCPSLCM